MKAPIYPAMCLPNAYVRYPLPFLHFSLHSQEGGEMWRRLEQHSDNSHDQTSYAGEALSGNGGAALNDASRRGAGSLCLKCASGNRCYSGP